MSKSSRLNDLVRSISEVHPRVDNIGDEETFYEHSYGQKFTLPSCTIYVIYTNYGQPNSLPASKTIGDGKGSTVVSAIPSLDPNIQYVIDRDWNPVRMTEDNTHLMIYEADKCSYILHIDQNGQVIGIA